MRKIFSLLLCFSLALSYAQGGIKFDEGNFKTLLAKAKKENKLLFVDAFTTWCGPCKLMSKNVFTTQQVGDFYNAKFINAKIDMEKGEGIDIAKKYNIKAFPTYIWVNGDGELIHTGVGYYEPDAFVKVGEEANDPTKQVVVLKKKFDAGDNDLTLLKSYYKAMAYRDRELAPKIASRYFANKPAETGYSEEDLGMLLNSVQTIDDEFYKIYLRDKSLIVAAAPAFKADNFEKAIKLNTVRAKAYNKETKVLDEKIFMDEALKLMTKEEAQKQLNALKMRLALSAKDYVAYEKLALDHYREAENFDADELNSAAWTFFERVSNNTSLQKALEWAKISVKKEEGFYNTDTLANLYNKIGDKASAKIWAQKAVDLGKAKGEDVADTQKLLDSVK